MQNNLPLFSLISVICVLLLSTGCDSGNGGDGKANTTSVSKQGYAGSDRCRRCHEDFYQLWATSHHGLAMQPFTADLARAQLTPSKKGIKIQDMTFTAIIDGDASCIHEQGPKGEHRYPMVHVLGGKNIFYFLTPLERGRLQVLPLAYDLNRKEWFDTTQSAVRHFPDMPDEALYWKESPLTFNTSCYSCHVSQLTTNYQFDTDTYHTEWREPGINCETCHGPSDEHITVCDQAAGGPPPEDLKIIQTSTFTHKQHNHTCAPCHAKMSPVTASFMPGDDYFDHYDLVTLEDPDFYPDGRDLGENYTYTLWRMNPCAVSGKLSCVHCHTSSGRYKFKEKDHNHACLPCHKERVENAPAHTHHKADSPASRCVACHMPMTEFARMHRSDHTMRPPTPAATAKFKSPNACNVCHDDKDAQWADRHVREWHDDDYQAPVLARAELLDAARKNQWTKLDAMLAFLDSEDCDEIYATSFIRLLANCDNLAWIPVVKKKLKDPSPLVRGAAVVTLGNVLQPDTLPGLIAASRDARRLVRVRAAAVLAPVLDGITDKQDREAVDRAMTEYLSSLDTRLDDFSAHYNRGNYFMARNKHEQAIKSFETAMRLQPSATAPFVNASMAYAQLSDATNAEQCLVKALQANPNSAAAHFNLGLLLAEQNNLRDAEDHLRAALKNDPRMDAAAYNLGILLSKDRLAKAIQWCRKAHKLRPWNPRYGYTLAFYQYQNGQAAEAATLLERLTTQKPPAADHFRLLGQIYEQTGQMDKAQRLYRSALLLPEIPEQDKQFFKSRIR